MLLAILLTIVSATSMAPLCSSHPTYLGVLAMVMLILAVLLFALSFVFKEKKKSLRQLAFVILCFTAILVIIYLFTPTILEALGIAPSAEPCA